MSATYDAIVLGCGGFGSAALYHLARRGCRVMGIDSFLPGHGRGSSHGQTRIIRQAYFEHSDYVPLARRAYELWRELEDESGQSLLRICGLMQAGPAQGEVVPGVRSAAEKFGIPIENFTAREATQAFPGFQFSDDQEIVLEPGAGILSVEDCVRTHVDRACNRGARLMIGAAVAHWWSDGKSASVTLTTGETLEAATLVITPGAWAPQVLQSVPNFPRIEVRRKVVMWHQVQPGFYDINRNGVTFLLECPYGVFYGFPSMDGATLKCGEHSGGQVVADPLTVDRSLQPDDIAAMRRYLTDHMPQVKAQPERHSVCLYSMSPDGHFIVDRVPRYSNVLFGAGFSGHGFKFTASIGAALAEWADTGRTASPIRFLALRPSR